MVHRIAGKVEETESKLSFQEWLPKITPQGCCFCRNQEVQNQKAGATAGPKPVRLCSTLQTDASCCVSFAMYLSLRPVPLIRETKSHSECRWKEGWKIVFLVMQPLPRAQWRGCASEFTTAAVAGLRERLPGWGLRTGNNTPSFIQWTFSEKLLCLGPQAGAVQKYCSCPWGTDHWKQ